VLHTLHFHCANGLATHLLARLLDSLVRVSRRVSSRGSCAARPAGQASAPVGMHEASQSERRPSSPQHAPHATMAVASLLTISRTFDSLFKVLFIFPSRYLFAIGLSSLFSLGWGIPPVLELHSQTARLVGQPKMQRTPHGTVTLCGVPFQATWARFA
jgi:hypothetical protein